MIYDTDQIKYYSVTRDSTYGNMTKGTAVIYDCVIEDTNNLIMNDKGQQVKPNALILIDSSFPGVKGEQIQLYKKFGTATGDTKYYEIMQVFEIGGTMSSHKEVYI